MYADPVRRRRAVRPSPIFLAFVATAVLSGWRAWDDSLSATAGKLAVFVFVISGWVISLCLHEFAHAYAAYRAGDHSVEAAGYLTLNPFKYAHPLLSIVLPLIFIAQGGIGLPGGAVYLHQHAFRTRIQRSIASAVGPLTNLVFAVALLQIAGTHDVAGPHGGFWAALSFLGFVQVSAALLNLLPVPGLDGYGIIEPYLSPETTRALASWKPFGMIGVFVLLSVPAINARYFDIVERLYDLAGGQQIAWIVGYQLFRFWR